MCIFEIKIGDIFYKVGDTDVSKKNPEEISSMIKNSSSKTVEVTMLRDKVEKKFSLTLEEVELESVVSKTFNKNG